MNTTVHKNKGYKRKDWQPKPFEERFVTINLLVKRKYVEKAREEVKPLLEKYR